MHIRKFITGSITALAIVASVALGAGSKVQAAQIPWNGGNLPSITTPVFNTYTGLPNGIGDEADFVRLRKSSGNNKDGQVTTNPATIYTDPLNAACNVGEKFDVRTYVHNGANDDFNNNGTGTAVAHNVTLAMRAPLGVTAKRFVFRSTVSGQSSDPARIPVTTVNDSGTLNCNSDVQLKLVPHTVHIYSPSYIPNDWVDGPDGAVNGSLRLGSRVPGSGDVWGCFNDRVVVVYTVEVVAVPQVPTYSCDLLQMTLLAPRSYRFTGNASVNGGATVKQYHFDFGDGTKQDVTSTEKTATVDHAYTRDGTFPSRVTVDFIVNGQVVSHTSDACAKTITLTPNKENCKIPGKEHLPVDSPECILVKTGAGPGDLVGIFGATTVAGAAAHNMFNRRRLGKR